MPYYLGFNRGIHYFGYQYHTLIEVVDDIRLLLRDDDGKLNADVSVGFYDGEDYIPLGQAQEGTLVHLFLAKLFR